MVAGVRWLKHNGPAIGPIRQLADHGARRVWRTFCRPGTSFIEHYACRGTSMIGATSLSPVTKLVAGTGAVSRYKVTRSQKTVKVYRILIAGRCACPGARTITNLSWVQEQKLRIRRLAETKSRLGGAKSVTNNLPILSVLWLVDIFLHFSPMFNIMIQC